MILGKFRAIICNWNMGNCSCIKKEDVIEIEESLEPLRSSKTTSRSISTTFSSTRTLSTKSNLASHKRDSENVNCRSLSRTAIDAAPSSIDRDDEIVLSSSLPAPLPPSGDIYKLKIGPNEELGSIEYQFSCLNEAKEQSRRTRRLIFVVEAELPGDKETGLEVLSHPLLVEAVTSIFITCEIHVERRKTRMSNQEGKQDYTKIRILDEDGVDVVPLVCGQYLYLGGVVGAIIDAMKVRNSSIPAYLSLLMEEFNGKKKESNGLVKRTERQVTFGMEDSNVGEIELAGLEGVIGTNAGYMNGESVVEVTYDSTRAYFSNVIQYALQKGVADTIYYHTNDERLASKVEIQRLGRYTQIVKNMGTMKSNLNSKRSLRQTMMRFVPLTDYQATLANRLCNLGVFDEAMHLLSPKQGMIMMNAIRSPKGVFCDVVDMPIGAAWKTLPRKTLAKPQ